MSTDTEIFGKHPLAKAIVDLVMKRLELIIVAAALGIYQQHHTHTAIWDETGQHFQDLVQQVQDLQVAVDGFTHTNQLYITTKGQANE